MKAKRSGMRALSLNAVTLTKKKWLVKLWSGISRPLTYQFPRTHPVFLQHMPSLVDRTHPVFTAHAILSTIYTHPTDASCFISCRPRPSCFRVTCRLALTVPALLSQHMPSHVMFRTGQWHESSEANLRAVALPDSDASYPEHNMNMLM